MFTTVLICLALLAVVAAQSTVWTCIDIQSTPLQGGAVWKTQNCTNDATTQPLLTVNSVSFSLPNHNLRAIPAVSVDPEHPLQGLPDMAAQNEKFIAGINGGYFWRVDIDGLWVDDVCRGKLRAEANKPANPKFVNFGVSDGLIKIDGRVFGNNCDCKGFSRPAILVLENDQSHIDVVYRGETVGKEVHNAIGAGPNLVSYNSTSGETFVDIKSDDDNINILEHAVSAFALAATHFFADFISFYRLTLLLDSSSSKTLRPRKSAPRRWSSSPLTAATSAVLVTSIAA